MSEQEKFNCHCKKYGWAHKTFFNRPHWTRRQFFELAGAGVGGAFLTRKYAKAADVAAAGVNIQGTADNVIFVLLPGVTPASFNPQTVNGVLWPAGLLPKLGNALGNGDFSIVRSMQSHALVHSLAQT